MSNEDNLFWDTVDREFEERKDDDAKVFRRFVIIPMHDFRDDWYEWGIKNIKQMNSRLSFLHRRATAKGLGEGAITHVNGLIDGVGSLQKKLETVKQKLDSKVIEPSGNLESPERIGILTDFTLNELFRDIMEVMRELKALRDQVDLLIGFSKP